MSANSHPTAFTDEDLERLKKEGPGNPGWIESFLLYDDKLDALIARLEAAEECIHQKKHDSFSHAYTAWCKAKGKSL